MALAQVSSLSSQDPSLSVPIGLKAKCHPYLGFARDDVLGSQLYINICTINRYPNRLRSFTVTCPGEPHCPNPSPIGVLFGPQPCFYIKGLRRKWSIYIYIYIWRKLIKNTLYCHPDYLSLIYHSPLFIPSDHEVDDLWLLCEQGVCGPGGSHQQSGGYQYKGRGWMKPLTLYKF